MKKLFAYLAIILFTVNVFAQAPEKMSYQAVVRDASNNLVTNQVVGMRVSVLQASLSGNAVYVEIQTPTTNSNGLISIEIGGGNVISGEFAKVDWANGPFFIKTETDPTGGSNYSIVGTSQFLSVPYALHAKTAEIVVGGVSETDPVFGISVASAITQTDTLNWNNKLDYYDETDPIFGASVASGISEKDTLNWNNKLDFYNETDPLFHASVAKGITKTDTALWNSKLDSYTETDPLFNSSVAKAITKIDTAIWNNKLDSFSETDPLFSAWLASQVPVKDTTNSNDKIDYTESDPIFSKSVAGEISATDIANWNSKLDSYDETDPQFGNSPASGITKADITSWNNKLDNYKETDPLFNASIAKGITAADTTKWNNKLDNYTETDPLFSKSVAKGITKSDTTNWNKKQDKLIAGNGINIVGNTISATVTGGGKTHYVGELYGGGVVFWVDHTGKHGLIVSMVDLSTEQYWSNVSLISLSTTYYVEPIGTTNDWDGLTNTSEVMKQDGHTNSAAKLCDDYTNADFGTGVYSDWYLPGIAELFCISSNFYEVQKALSSDGNSTTTPLSWNTFYWSSTEYDKDDAWQMDFGFNESYHSNKDLGISVRAIRAF